MSHLGRQHVTSVSAFSNSIAPYDLSQRPKYQQMVNEVSGETVKQPMNPFLIWCKTKRGEMLKTQQGMRPCDVSKQLGEIWRNMSEEDKKPFVDQARVLKSEHQKNHPDFKRKHKKQKNKHPATYETQKTSTSKTASSSAGFAPSAIQNTQYYPALSTPTTQAPTFTAQFVPTTQHGYQYNFPSPTTPTTSASSVTNQMVTGTQASNMPFFF